MPRCPNAGPLQKFHHFYFSSCRKRRRLCGNNTVEEEFLAILHTARIWNTNQLALALTRKYTIEFESIAAIHKIVNEANSNSFANLQTHMRSCTLYAMNHGNAPLPPSTIASCTLFCTWDYYLWQCQPEMNQLRRSRYPMLLLLMPKPKTKNRKKL